MPLLLARESRCKRKCPNWHIKLRWYTSGFYFQISTLKYSYQTHSSSRSIVWLSALPSHIVFYIVFAQCITFACYLWFTYFVLPFWIVCPADCLFRFSDCLCLFFWPCFCLMIVDYSALAFIKLFYSAHGSCSATFTKGSKAAWAV